MQLADILASIKRHARLALAICLAAVLGLGIFLFTRQEARGGDRYQARVQLLVPARSLEDGTFPEGVPPSLTTGQAAVALSGEVTQAALAASGVPAEQWDDVSFDFTRNEAGDILTLTATADDSDQAVATVEAWISTYNTSRRDTAAAASVAARENARRALIPLDQKLSEVEAQLVAIDPSLLGILGATSAAEGEPNPVLDIPLGTPLETVLLIYERNALLDSKLANQLAYARASAAALTPSAFSTVLERFRPEQIVPELPSPLLPTALFMGGGLLLACLVPVLLDRADRSIREPGQATESLGAPVLATLPATRKQAVLAGAGSPSGAAYRALAVTSVATDRLPNAILVTAPSGRAQDMVAANFAAALADLGVTVALVATDPRHSWYLDASGAVLSGVDATLPDLLDLAQAGQLNGSLSKRLVGTSRENLLVVPPGKTPFHGTLDALPSLLAALSESGIDVTVIAGPAILEDPNATIMAWSTRSVMWAVRGGQITDDEAEEAASRLNLAGVVPFGIALIDAG